MEDHDDLMPVFAAQSDLLSATYGEFFLADMIELQDSNNKARHRRRGTAGARAFCRTTLSDMFQLLVSATLLWGGTFAGGLPRCGGHLFASNICWGFHTCRQTQFGCSTLVWTCGMRFFCTNLFLKRIAKRCTAIIVGFRVHVDFNMSPGHNIRRKTTGEALG